MSDSRPDSPPEPTDPDGDPSGSTFLDQDGPGEALETNPDLPLIDPAGG